MLISTSERLTLRHFTERDDEFVFTLLNDDAFLKNIGDKQIRTTDDAVNYILNGPIASYKEHGFGLNVVCLKSNNMPIGMCGLLKRADFEHADLGFAFLPEYCGQGFAHESSLLVLKDSYKKYLLPIISAITSTDNIKSNNLLQRLGFVLMSNIEFHSTLNNYYELKNIEFN